MCFSDYLVFWHSHLHPDSPLFLTFSSECWALDPVIWPVGSFYLSLPPWLKTLVTPLIIIAM